MIHKYATAATLLALSALLASSASAHAYWPSDFSWEKRGDGCFIKWWVPDPPQNNDWEDGRRVKEVVLNFCIAKQSIASDWSNTGDWLENTGACLGNPKWARQGSLMLRNQTSRATNTHWERRIRFVDVEIDANDPTHYSNGNPVRYLISVQFWTGSRVHHADGQHLVSERVDGICAGEDAN